MNCDKWQTLIMRKIDNEISAVQTRDLSIHLSSCPHCLKLNRDLEQILTVLEDQPSLDLKIDPRLELTVMQEIRRIKYHSPSQDGIIRLAYTGLGLVFTGILLNLGLKLTNSNFLNLFLLVNTGLSQVTSFLTKLEIVYRILQPFVFQELNNLAQWIMAAYKGTILLSVVLLVWLVSIQRRYITEDNRQ